MQYKIKPSENGKTFVFEKDRKFLKGCREDFVAFVKYARIADSSAFEC
jgi:hypothetical protein